MLKCGNADQRRIVAPHAGMRADFRHVLPQPTPAGFSKNADFSCPAVRFNGRAPLHDPVHGIGHGINHGIDHGIGRRRKTSAVLALLPHMRRGHAPQEGSAA